MPCGRGVFKLGDKTILGYVENGGWAIGSHQIVIERTRNEFRVFKLIRGRNGTLFQLG